MSVLKINQKESKWEPIIQSIAVHDLLIDLMQKNFGIKDMEHFVRKRYARGAGKHEDYYRYKFLMTGFKKRIDELSSLLTSNVRAANSMYPNTLHEFEIRRDYQNSALVNCEQIIKELQRVADIFEVNLNKFKAVNDAIGRETDLIKRWKQRDRKIESYLTGNV